MFCLHRGAPQKARMATGNKPTDFPIIHYSQTPTAHHNLNLTVKFQEHTSSVIFINCVNCDLMMKQYHEAVTELKSLRLINKLLFEKIKKREILG